MCFFFGLASTPLKLAKRYQRLPDRVKDFAPRVKINGFAQPLHPIVLANEAHFDLAHWGLPSWAGPTPHLNARVETLADKPRFSALAAQRCLIPATLFYEWRHQGPHKIPYEIRYEGLELFSMAGLYEDVAQPNGTTLRYFTLLTTEANPLMAYVHNHKKRMPIILAPEQESVFLAQAPLPSFAYPTWDPPLLAEVQAGGLLSLDL